MTTRISEIIDQRIKERGLTQRQVSKRSGLAMSTISRLRNGKAIRGKASTLERLAKALRMPLEQLLEATGRTGPAEQYLNREERSITTKLGEIIDRWLKQQGLNQQQLADRCGLAGAVISRLRRGKTIRGAVPSLERIAVAMDVPVEELLAATDRHDLADRYHARRVLSTLAGSSGQGVTLPVKSIDDRLHPPGRSSHTGLPLEYMLLCQKLHLSIGHDILDDDAFKRLPELAQQTLCRQLRSAVYQAETARMTSELIVLMASQCAS